MGNIMFDPSVVLKDRKGEPMKTDRKEDATTGSISVMALDNVTGRGDGKDLTRQFRISSQILDAKESGKMLPMPSDELDLVTDIVRQFCVKLMQEGTLVYGRFMEAVETMKEASKKGPELVKAENK